MNWGEMDGENEMGLYLARNVPRVYKDGDVAKLSVGINGVHECRYTIWTKVIGRYLLINEFRCFIQTRCQRSIKIKHLATQSGLQTFAKVNSVNSSVVLS